MPDLPDLEPIPAALPAELLQRRPDIQAAEMRLAAATAQVGVNIAQLYPNLTLTASGGFRSDELADLLSADNLVASAIAAVAQPIFQGGQLRAQVDAAEAERQAAIATYAQTIVNAFREVEDALVREQFLRQRIALLQERLTQVKLAEESAMSRYQTGISQLLLVLETQRRRLIAENELQLAKGSFWNARIDLFLALGGDWVSSEQPATVSMNN